MVKGKDLLDCNLATGGFVQSSGHCAVGTFTNRMKQLIVVAWTRLVAEQGCIRDGKHRSRTWAEAWALYE